MEGKQLVLRSYAQLALRFPDEGGVGGVDATEEEGHFGDRWGVHTEETPKSARAGSEGKSRTRLAEASNFARLTRDMIRLEASSLGPDE